MPTKSLPEFSIAFLRFLARRVLGGPSRDQCLPELDRIQTDLARSTDLKMGEISSLSSIADIEGIWTGRFAVIPESYVTEFVEHHTGLPEVQQFKDRQGKARIVLADYVRLLSFLVEHSLNGKCRDPTRAETIVKEETKHSITFSNVSLFAFAQAVALLSRFLGLYVHGKRVQRLYKLSRWGKFNIENSGFIEELTQNNEFKMAQVLYIKTCLIMHNLKVLCLPVLEGLRRRGYEDYVHSSYGEEAYSAACMLSEIEETLGDKAAMDVARAALDIPLISAGIFRGFSFSTICALRKHTPMNRLKKAWENTCGQVEGLKQLPEDLGISISDDFEKGRSFFWYLNNADVPHFIYTFLLGKMLTRIPYLAKYYLPVLLGPKRSMTVTYAFVPGAWTFVEKQTIADLVSFLRVQAGFNVVYDPALGLISEHEILRPPPALEDTFGNVQLIQLQKFLMNFSISASTSVVSHRRYLSFLQKLIPLNYDSEWIESLFQNMRDSISELTVVQRLIEEQITDERALQHHVKKCVRDFERGYLTTLSELLHGKFRARSRKIMSLLNAVWAHGWQ